MYPFCLTTNSETTIVIKEDLLVTISLHLILAWRVTQKLDLFVYGKGGTFQAAVRFQGSDVFLKAVKLVLRCILRVVQGSQFSLLQGFTFTPS